MESLSKAIVVLIRKCLQEDLKGTKDFTREDFNNIGFVSSQPLAVLLNEETKRVANDYGFDYVDDQLNPEILRFINRIEDLSDGKTHRYKMYSYVNNELISNTIEISNIDTELGKSITTVLQNREKLLQE